MEGFGGELLSKVDNESPAVYQESVHKYAKTHWAVDDWRRACESLLYNVVPCTGDWFSLICSVLIHTKIEILALYIEGKGEYFDSATILGILRGLKYLRGFWTNK